MIFMPAYKDEKTGKWFAKFYYTNWQGIKKQKWKRGFATKKEALGFERDFLEKQSANPDMTFQNLYEIYMEDMAARLKQSTLLTKKAGDPETSFSGSPGNSNYGVDFGLQPVLRTFIFGLNLNF